MTDVRGASLDCLVRIMDEGQYSHVVLKEALEKLQFRDRRDRAFFTRLTEGVVERALELDYMIDQFSPGQDREDEAGHPGNFKDGRLSDQIYGFRAGQRRHQ